MFISLIFNVLTWKNNIKYHMPTMGNMHQYIVTTEGCPFLGMQFNRLNDDEWLKTNFFYLLLTYCMNLD